jgi:DNA replication protein DnaC
MRSLRSLQTQEQTLRARAQDLRLYGLLAHWPAIQQEPWVAHLVRWEEDERARRSLKRRVKNAHVGNFKALCDFDWSWPSRCDRGAIEDLGTLGFMKDATNVVFIGPNGVGKSTLAKNVAQQALVHGHKVLFTTAGEILGELAAFDSASTLGRRLSHYVELDLLVIDEVDNRSYSDRHADLLFELVSRRYQKNSTIVISNRPLSEWHEVFPNAACTSSLVDRLAHLAEVISIEGESYAMKEACERAVERSHKRGSGKSAKPGESL